MELVSFDGGTSARQRVVRPDRYRHLVSLDPNEVRIVRGGGYSYAAAGFGSAGVVQDCRAFDRVLAFDEQVGVVQCEAGTTLGKLHSVVVPRGWYLPVQPGYPGITVGGCIASDAHGKNQLRDGTFRRLVRDMRLFHPRHGVLLLDDVHQPEWLELTCGGLGLTGQIMSATLQLARLPGHRVVVTKTPVERFEDVLGMLEARGPSVDFIYTWHNFSTQGDRFGRGFLYAGVFVPGSRSLPEDGARVTPIASHSRGRLRVQLLNRATTGPFNHAYELFQKLGPATKEIGLYPFLFPVARKVLYFKLFGTRGFHEYQMLIPGSAVGALSRELRRRIATEPVPITLASCKLFGGRQTYLRFDGSGLCLALNFPRGPLGTRFAGYLDDLVRDLGGVPNIIKDSRLPRAVVETCYKDYAGFRQALGRFDPDRLYRSELSDRLGL